VLVDREIIIVGYGNQGKAWAANLRDSGWKVTVSGRAGSSVSLAKEHGFPTLAPEELRAQKGLIALLLPDEVTPIFFSQFLTDSPHSRSFLFAHGFAVTFGGIAPGVRDDLILVAPKGIGQKVRERFLAGSGVMGVVAVEQDASGNAWEISDFVAEGLGLKRIGLIRSRFQHETQADLFSEQVILCGALPLLVEKSIAYLVSKGIDPALARYECLNEVQLIADMMVEHGVEGMLKRVSSVALLGGRKGAAALFPPGDLETKMDSLWSRIEDGSFAQDVFSQRKKPAGAIVNNSAEASP